MGMARCPDHGLSHVVTCCTHVAQAVAGRTGEPGAVVVDDWVTPSLACARCVLAIRAAGRTPESAQVGFAHALHEPMVGYCVECVRDWFAATGQGELSEAVASAVRVARSPSRS